MGSGRETVSHVKRVGVKDLNDAKTVYGNVVGQNVFGQSDACDEARARPSSNTVEVVRYPELVGARTLVTGATQCLGGELIAALAAQGARLLVETTGGDALNDIAPNCSGVAIEMPRAPAGQVESVRKTAQTAARTFGSLDIAVNLIPIPLEDLGTIESEHDLEDMLAEHLSAAIVATEIAANRMGLMWTSGVVLNVLALRSQDAECDPIIELLVRDALAAMTRIEAEKWADHGVRINAVTGHMASSGEPVADGQQDDSLTRVALRILSDECAELSGVMFDA